MSLRLVSGICWSHQFPPGDVRKCRARVRREPAILKDQVTETLDILGRIRKGDSGAPWVQISALPVSDSVTLAGYLSFSSFIFKMEIIREQPRTAGRSKRDDNVYDDTN